MEQLSPKETIENDKAANDFKIALQPILDSVRKIGLSLESSVLIFNNSLAPLTETIQVLQRSFQSLVENEQKKKAVAKAFQDCNLWLAPSMIPIVDRIVELYEKNSKQMIPEVVTRYYVENDYYNLIKAVKSWKTNRFFKPRMRIFNDALEAHINGKFTLSVPALLPHIEGIPYEIIKEHKIRAPAKPIFYNNDPESLFYNKDIAGQDGDKTKASRIFANISFGTFSFNEWVAIYSLLYYLEGTMYLSPRKHQKKLEDFATKDILNRHSILHGVHVKYNTSMNSLKCFLALDVISLLNDFVKINDKSI